MATLSKTIDRLDPGFLSPSPAVGSRVRARRLEHRHVKERTDPELRGHTVVPEIGTYENVVLGDERHLGMTL